MPVDQNPALNIIKDATDARRTTVVDVAGDVINYTITVANTGNTTLTGRDGDRPVRRCRQHRARRHRRGRRRRHLLEVGETWGYTAAHTVTQAEIDANGGGDGMPARTRRTADSRPRPGRRHRRRHRCRSQNPALNITKDVDVTGAAPADSAGDVINYTITVANTGNTTLTGVTVTDPYADAG